MTRTEAIEETKHTGSASHPNGAYLSLEVKVISHKPRREERRVTFHGDCSPKTGWQVDYLGER